MYKKLNRFVYHLKEEFKLYLSISLGLFLFVLFFEPFPLEKMEYNNRLVFIAGLAGIVFMIVVIVRNTMPRLFENKNHELYKLPFPTFLEGFLILALTSVSFAFYIRYVANIPITFHIMFKVVVISLIPPVTLRLYDLIHYLQWQNQILKNNITASENETKTKNPVIEIESENKTEHVKMLADDVAFIKSADNYVEIVFREDGEMKKRLIRNTLKNIEEQIKSCTNFLRCHRICIVNTSHIEKLQRFRSNYVISIKGISEKIPVSRQYLLKLKESV